MRFRVPGWSGDCPGWTPPWHEAIVTRRLFRRANSTLTFSLAPLPVFLLPGWGRRGAANRVGKMQVVSWVVKNEGPPALREILAPPWNASGRRGVMSATLRREMAERASRRGGAEPLWSCEKI